MAHERAPGRELETVSHGGAGPLVASAGKLVAKRAPALTRGGELRDGVNVAIGRSAV